MVPQRHPSFRPTVLLAVLCTCAAWAACPAVAAPPAATAPAATQPDAGWFNFIDARGVPDYLKVVRDAVIDDQGLHGAAFTADTGLLRHDFVFDVMFERADEDDQRRSGVLVGIGEGRFDDGMLKNSVAIELHGQNIGLIADAAGHLNDVANTMEPDRAAAAAKAARKPALPPIAMKPGPCVLRLAKTGKSLTLSACFGYDGTFHADFTKQFPDLRAKAPYLTPVNSTLFFFHRAENPLVGATFTGVRLIVDGKPATPGDIPSAKPAVALEDAAFFRFSPTSGLPPYLKADDHVMVEGAALGGGLRGGELRTRAADLIRHDFTFDVLFTFPGGTDDRTKFIIGLGENAHEGGWVLNSAGARLQGPADHGGEVNLFQHEGHEGRPILVGNVARNPGPHVVRLEKRGNTLTVALCVNYKGTFDPTFIKTWPDLKALAPYLNENNAAVFVAPDDPGDQHTAWLATRMAVDGKPLATGTPPAPVAGADVSGPQDLLPLAPKSIPTFLLPQRDLPFARDGGVTLKYPQALHTVATDYLTKDFTFDVVYRHPDQDAQGFFMGLGEGQPEGGTVLNAIAFKINPPRTGDAWVELFRNHDTFPRLAVLGKNSGAGPHMARLRKKGNTLTISVTDAGDGTFKPMFTRSIPDVRAFAPFLTNRNSGLFINAGADILKARLVIDGEAVESQDLALQLPPRAVVGRTTRQFLAKDAVPGRTFVLEAGPKGATLSPAGELTWTPTPDQVGTQKFRVVVRQGAEAKAVRADVEVYSAAEASAAGADPAKLDTMYRLPLVAEGPVFADGADGKTLLLLDGGDTLKRLDADGVTVRSSHKLSKHYNFIADRTTYVLALSVEGKTLDLLDATTLEITRSIQMDYREVTDLALNPRKPVCYVAVYTPGDGPHYRVMEVDERSGDVREHEDFIGRWIKISPDGARAYTGYKDIYEKGMRLLANPDRWDVIPEYGNIDLLIVYDLTGARPREIALKRDAGGNGSGLALSADGRRLSYLSHVGYPVFSGNVPAWDPADLNKRPVSYPTKANNVPPPLKIDFNPVLPIAAAPTETGAICFDRETGQVQPNRLDLRHPLDAGTKPLDVRFAPGGRDLLMVCEKDKTSFYLRRVPLNLSPQEEAALNAPRPKPPVERINNGNPRVDIRD